MLEDDKFKPANYQLMPSKYSRTALTFFVTMNNKTISASALDRNEEMIRQAK